MTRRLLSCAVVVGVIAFQPFVDAGAFQRVVAPPSIMDAPAPEPTIDSPDTDAPPEAIAAADAAARAASATPTAAPAPFVPAGGLAPDPTPPPAAAPVAPPATDAPTAVPTAEAVQVPSGPSRAAAPVTVEATVSTPEPQEASGNARSVDQAGYVYSYAVDENRYDDIATSIDAYKPLGDPKMRVRPYVAALYDRDTRTNAGGPGQNGGPPVPLVLADNYALGAAGLQFTTPGGLRLFGQVGRSFTVGPVAAQPSGNDARGGAQLYREWGPAYVPGRDYGNFYGSVEYLSRYSDTISYNQLELVRNAGTTKIPVEVFGRIVATLDTRQHYYSNVVELTAGIRVHPFGVHGPIVSVEQTGGDYLRGTLPQNVHRAYLDFRPTISYGFNI